MRSMNQARQRAREERERVGHGTSDLLRRLVDHMESDHGIAFIEMSPAQMRGSDAEVDGDRILKFKSTLTAAERLMVFAHELGHVVLHERLMNPDVLVDDIVASAYGSAGPAAIARYSPRVREEAEATAFAQEFLCPSALVFGRWREARGGIAIARLAEEFGVEFHVAQIQLANALYDVATGADREDGAGRPEVPFTPEQVEAAKHTGGPALVDAGPGTGKTATVIRRLEFALEEQKAEPSQVLVLTFSNEAVQEVYERIAARFGSRTADHMTIATFHGFGMELVRWHREQMGLMDNFTLMEEDGQAELVLELLGSVPCPTLDPIKDPAEVATDVVKYINHLKHRRIDADALEAAIDAWTPAEGRRDDPEAGRELLALYRAYESEKQKRGVVDMADLILLPLRLLEQGGEVQEAYIRKYPWIVVDEFQDVTRATSALVRAVAGGRNEPWVVGDARQAIYQFLGAAADNVRNFAAEFEGSRIYALRENHRASPPIVEAANQMASLFPDAGDTHRWKAVANVEPFGDVPVRIAEATSDHAEAEGIVDQIVEWQRAGMEPGDIAVLARRHVDVRSVALALTARGIKAESAGLLTAEGAAGDLAAVLTLAGKRPAASLPRLIVALGRGRHCREEINGTIEHLLRIERAKERSEAGDIAKAESASEALLAEVEVAREHAGREHFKADGFDCLMTFLFDGSAYLRRVLDAPDSALRSMNLVEIVSTLSLATAYRVTHPGGEGAGKRHHRRYAFAERLRLRLTETVPIPIAPAPRRDAVRVMTCHASKGLEFPCVIVSGQTMPKMKASWSWIPQGCRPGEAEEADQANALLFVGVTRAKRAVVVSYPEKATESERSRAKKVVPLLQAWGEKFGVPRKRWCAAGGAVERAAMGSVWGRPLEEEEPERKRYFKPSVLGDGVCTIRHYMEDVLGMRFPEAERALYPGWFDAVRKSLRECAKRAMAGSVSEDEAEAVFDEQFSEGINGDHPHFEMYRGMGRRIVRGFAVAFKPAGGTEYLEPEFTIAPSGGGRPVRLDLIARFKEPGGGEVAIGFRPESKIALVNEKKQSIAWSKLGASPISYVLVWQNNPGTAARVFSGADGVVHALEWKKGGLAKDVAELKERHAAMVAGDYSHEIDDYECERRCRMRVTCPHWIGALE